MEAISEFIIDDIAKDIKDASVKVIAIAVGKVMKKKPEVFDKILENQLVCAFLGKSEDGNFDLGMVEELLKEMVCNGDKIYLTIPSIPLLHPGETRLGLTYNDVEKFFEKFVNV